MITFIAVMIHFTVSNAQIYLRGLLVKKNPLAWFFVAWGALLFGAQIIDKPHLFHGLLKKLAEESMELGASIMMLLILLSYPFRINRSHDHRPGF